MASVNELKTYYINNVEKKVFYKLEVVTTNNYSIMYLHDLTSEKKSFVDTFSLYFPYYVGTEETLQFIDVSKNPEISLSDLSKMCWGWPTVPNREVTANGIFGELFLDFYERIVKGRKLFTTYASRRSFASNDESKGYDHLSYIINNHKLEIVLGESKYVNTIYSAKKNLLEDINGTSDKQGHLTSTYLNGFMNFIVLSNKPFSNEERCDLELLLNDLNKNLCEKKTFLEYIIEKDIKVNIVLFAIYQDSRDNPNQVKTIYDELYVEAEKALRNMGINTFSIEIVFIPTENKSMTIKEEITKFYE